MRRVSDREGLKGYGDGDGWVAPSLMSRVFNIHTWVNRLRKIYPVNSIALELVKFDTQLLENPEITGIEYQQGTLHGYEVREYLLEKHKRKCAYCGKGDVKFEVEHIIPKALGGTNRIGNLTLACHSCNSKKGSTPPHQIEDKAFRKKVESVAKNAKQSLKDKASVNTIRWKIDETLKATGLPITYGSGGKTKFHRTKSELPQTHYLDAACIADEIEATSRFVGALHQSEGLWSTGSVFFFRRGKPKQDTACG